MKKGIVLLLVLMATAVWALPQGIVFILDASNSMNLELPTGETRFHWAQRALTLVLEELPAGVPFAVVAFGHRVSRELEDESCLDIELLVPYGLHEDRFAIANLIRGLRAQGKTPLARALRFAAGVVDEPVRLVLLTDGEETCGGDPLAAAQEICAGGTTLDVVAVGVEAEVAALLGSLARVCGGQFVVTQDPAELPALFRQVAIPTPTPPQPEIPAAYRCYQVDNVIWGTEGDDVLVGTPARDLILGLGGNDLLIGLGGNDILVGGPGDDVLQGGECSDRLEGGPGNDRLLGGPGNDILLGGDGNDSLEGEEGDDQLVGGPCNDNLLGGPGCDQLDGGPGNNFIYDVEQPCPSCAPVPSTCQRVPPPPAPPPCPAPGVKVVDEGSSITIRALWEDPDGDPVSVRWEILSGGGTIADPTAAVTTYCAPWISECEGRPVELLVTVTDACGASAQDRLCLWVRNVNHPPLADAGPDIRVREGETVQLTCSASDPDGDAITYEWVVECNRGTLSDRYALHPYFTAPLTDRCEGEDIVLTLIVRDACGAEAQDSLIVHVENVNQLPWVDAGPDLSVPECGQIMILAEAGDPDGEPLTICWEIVEGGGSLANAYTLCPVFTAPEVTGCQETMVRIRITVTDPCGGTASDELCIRVYNLNQPPRVEADP